MTDPFEMLGVTRVDSDEVVQRAAVDLLRHLDQQLRQVTDVRGQADIREISTQAAQAYEAIRIERPGLPPFEALRPSEPPPPPSPYPGLGATLPPPPPRQLISTVPRRRFPKPLRAVAGLVVPAGIFFVMLAIGDQPKIEVDACVEFADDSDDVTATDCSSDSADGLIVSFVGDPSECPPTTEETVVTTGAGSTGGYYCVDLVNHPDTWDPTIADLVSEVEAARELDFLHPVGLVVLNDEAFEARLIEMNAPVESETTATSSEIDEASLYDEGYVRHLRALGLMSGDLSDVDLEEVETTGVVGYFDSLTEELVIRQEMPDVVYRSTVVHELVHALQHQHFGLNRVLPTPDAWVGWQGLIEGDARRIETDWLAGQNEADLTEFEEYQGADDLVPDVPPLFIVELASPYLFGMAAVDLIDGFGGVEAVNALFDDPPTTSMLLTNPLLVQDRTTSVPEAPPLPDGAEILVEEELGSLKLWQMIGGRIDHDLAHDAIDEWSGGITVDYLSSEGDLCVAGRVATAPDVVSFALPLAMQAWADGMGFPVLISTNESGVDFVSCDPGPDGPSPDVALLAPTFWEPATEFTVAASIVEVADPPFSSDVAQCVLNVVRDELTPEERTDASIIDEDRTSALVALVTPCQVE